MKWFVGRSNRFLGTSGHFMASNGAGNALVNNVRLSNSVSPDLVVTGSENSIDGAMPESVVKKVDVDFGRFGRTNKTCC